ncbi:MULTISPECIES: glycosyltransferase [Nitrospirillum]|uniref:Glycosyltransferase involved in cell wall biosynthesis n=1 Tax=Nitrospirillum amazonense TaxID=28077 RepID=A0A560GDJ2_9PROT|nr:glycosyltransferase [Nitrospirillum amazonense]MEC4592238.1 glycosyltransferase [Nitrospirillum amazonense]TWB31978.1 glycosyltransferase involved in cell wall biosynthesis [Nitrospirillum amazonense]
MRCLWITLADPDPPHNGQFIYSGGLIGSLAQAGADMAVLGLSRPDGKRADGARETPGAGAIAWHLAEHKPRSRWSSLRSPLPNIAHRCGTPDMHARVRRLLATESWDSVVLDGIGSGWALADFLRRYPDRHNRPKLVYVSHNHEESLRAQLAQNQSNLLKHQAMRFDAAKVTHLERAIVKEADLITAITPDDADLYREHWPDKAMAVLTPGYRATEREKKPISRDLPRRAVIVGSFDWIAKRMNLEEFISVADAIFAANGVELEVVGSGDATFLASMRKRVLATRFTGTVDDVRRHMDAARIALVPERNGGGFKLKVLDYVFNRLPILALKGSVAGVPLEQEESILLYPGHEDLAMGVVQSIDDLDRLNNLQDAAYRACRDSFHWTSRGPQLLSAIAAA